MSMEPLIITVDSNGKVAMSVSEIKALLDKAYKMGKDSGGYNYYWYPGWSTTSATISGSGLSSGYQKSGTTYTSACVESYLKQKEPDNG